MTRGLGRVVRGAQVGVVSLYLAAVGLWLLFRRRIPRGALRRVAVARLKRPYRGRLTTFHHEEGLAWIAPVPDSLLSDMESSSSLVVYEDGEPLGPPHAAHADVRLLGGGRYSHWGARIYLSTTDGSDPRSNGRAYEALEVR